jgi:hypothetical protein
MSVFGLAFPTAGVQSRYQQGITMRILKEPVRENRRLVGQWVAVWLYPFDWTMSATERSRLGGNDIPSHDEEDQFSIRSTENLPR